MWRRGEREGKLEREMNKKKKSKDWRTMDREDTRWRNRRIGSQEDRGGTGRIERNTDQKKERERVIERTKWMGKQKAERRGAGNRRSD